MISKKIKRIVQVILIAGFSILMLSLVTNYLVRRATDKSVYIKVNEIPKAKVALIFGAGIRGNKPSRYLKDRLDAGIKLYKTNKVNKILLSGDNGREEYDELTVMKLYCYENGVDTNKIYIDYAGFDSYSTMYRAKAIFKIDTAVLITQRYHLNRCLYIGKKLGIKVYGLSANRGIYKGYRYYAVREYLSVCKAVLDIFRNRKPKFLGKEISIDGPSNYTKQ